MGKATSPPLLTTSAAWAMAGFSGLVASTFITTVFRDGICPPLPGLRRSGGDVPAIVTALKMDAGEVEINPFPCLGQGLAAGHHGEHSPPIGIDLPTDLAHSPFFLKSH